MSDGVNMLRDIEWSGRAGVPPEASACPCCAGVRPEEAERDCVQRQYAFLKMQVPAGHLETCALAATLRAGEDAPGPDAHAKGRADERAAVVAWLMSSNIVSHPFRRALADAIERGEHRRGPR